MSQKIAIVTDSISDLGDLAVDITVVPLTIRFGNEQFRDGLDLTAQQFYDRLEHDTAHHPTSSQPPPAAFEQAYKGLLDAGAEHIVSIHASAALSGTFNSASLAAQQVAPERITVIDTRNASAGEGLLVLEARDQAARGESVEAIVAKAQADIPNDMLLAAIPTLTFLARGGRIGALQSVLGNVLQIVPIITLKDGLVAEHSKVRTFSRAVDQIIEIVKSKVPQKKHARCAVMHSVAPELAAKVRERLEVAIEPASMITTIAGPTVGTHAGPGAVGVFFIP
jgi:DegV family protein with EDD domain